MASGDAWNAGWNLGSQLAAHRQARKEDLSDKEFGTNFNELQTNIGNLQQKLATFPEGSKERDAVQQNLAQALEARNSMFAKQPGAMQKFGHLLHLTKAEPTQLPAPPGYQPTLQTRGQAAPVKPPRTPAELRARAEAQMMAGAAPAPLTEKQEADQAVQKAQVGTAGMMEKIRGDLDAIKAFHKDATPDELKALNNAYLDKALGTTAPKEEKWTMVGKPYTKDGKAYVDERSPTGEQRASEWTGAPPAPPKLSAYQEQEAAFARTIGKEPSQWGEPETQAFLKMRYGAMQPLARTRLAIADQTLHLNAARLRLAQAQNNMRDYLSVQKALTPFDKIKTTAERADEYVNKPTGAGDIALTLAFVDAIKPGTGFRFTDTERKWMVAESRGVIDGALAKINQGYTGQTLTPEQRVNERNIIKQAAAQADQQRNKTLSGFGQINPRVAKIAGGGNTPAPQKNKKGGGKTLADRLNDALGGK
jgi:hypothetical protein